MSDRDSEPAWELHGFVDVPVERVGDEHDWDLDLVLTVDKLLERLERRIQHLCASRKYSVNVETDSKFRLFVIETTT